MSKARVDLPDPLTPVMTVSWLSGIVTSMFLRLFCSAPRTMMGPSPVLFSGIDQRDQSSMQVDQAFVLLVRLEDRNHML